MMSRITDKVAEIVPVDGVVVANGRFHEEFQAWLGGYEAPFPLKIVNDGTITNETRLGAVADLDLALSSADPRPDIDGYLVAACDNLFDFDLSRLVDRFKKTGRGQLIVRQVPVPVPPGKYSEVVIDGERVSSFREKPADPKSNLSAIAIYLLPRNLPELVKEFLATGANPDAPGHLIAWLSGKLELEATPIDGLWMDIGSPEDLAKANEQIV
jgi:glucose-1-phosphate thymidylyltransferase